MHPLWRKYPEHLTQRYATLKLSSGQHVWLLSHLQITQKLEAICPIVQKFKPYRNNQKALIHPHLSKIRSTSLRKYTNHRPRRQNVDYFGSKRNNTDLTQDFINTPCAFFFITQLRMSCYNIGPQRILQSGRLAIYLPPRWPLITSLRGETLNYKAVAM